MASSTLRTGDIREEFRDVAQERPEGDLWAMVATVDSIPPPLVQLEALGEF